VKTILKPWVIKLKDVFLSADSVNPTLSATDYPKDTLIVTPFGFFQKNQDGVNTNATLINTCICPPPIGGDIFHYVNIHYVKGNGTNQTFTNGSFFRTYPSTYACGSNSGYASAFPSLIPFDCIVDSIVLIFRRADFDWSADAGLIQMEIENSGHYYNGNYIINRILLQFGHFGAGAIGWNTSTGDGDFMFTALEGTSGSRFSFISGSNIIPKDTLLGCRFVKAPPGGDRRINSFRDIVVQLRLKKI